MNVQIKTAAMRPNRKFLIWQTSVYQTRDVVPYLNAEEMITRVPVRAVTGR
jgi:hypothetical protein